jgi:drug/metabolite transporter (DMT)-like permease
MWRKFLFQASMNSVVPFSLIAWAERSVESGLAAILNSTSPIFVLLITWMWTRHEPATGRKLVGVILGLAGIVVITGFGALSGLGRTTAAQLVIVAATLCYAVAAVFGRNFAGHAPLIPAAGSMICASLLMVPLSVVVDKPWTLSPSGLSIAALACLGTFSTAGALVVYFRLLATLGSIGTAGSSYLRAAVSVLLGIVFLGERLAPQTWAGLALVLTGVGAVAAPANGRPRCRAVRSDPRYFAVSLFGGRFFAHGLAPLDPWDATRLEYRPEPDVSAITLAPSDQRMIRTSRELRDIFNNLSPDAPTETLWVREDLAGEVGEARRALYERAGCRAPAAPGAGS